MITVNVEKEIKQENKIIGKFTVRQVMFIIAALGIVTAFYFLVRPSLDTAMGVGMIIGVIAWFFGFHKKNGLPVEYFMWKKLKLVILRNFGREYRTKNKYITMLNNAYQLQKMTDIQDKRKAKALKKREKRKSSKKSKLRAYC